MSILKRFRIWRLMQRLRRQVANDIDVPNCWACGGMGDYPRCVECGIVFSHSMNIGMKAKNELAGQ